MTTFDKDDITHWYDFFKSYTITDIASLSPYKDALLLFPQSYKLWKEYLTQYRKLLRGLAPFQAHLENENEDMKKNNEIYHDISHVYSLALQYCSTMPVLYLDYMQFCMETFQFTKCRQIFNQALSHLCIYQHARIWDVYFAFLKKYKTLNLITVQMYIRYVHFAPEAHSDFIAFCEKEELVDVLCTQVAQALKDGISTSTSDRFTLWMKFCTAVSSHAILESDAFDVEAILRSGMVELPSQVGTLWCALASYNIQLGYFERAGEIYEEAFLAVLTVRDFGMVFDAYAKFVEEVVMAHMHMEDSNDAEVDMGLAKLEHLTERRPLLMSSVLLRQNPQNVREWQKRIALMMKSSYEEAKNTYTEAIETINPKEAIGPLWQLWTNYAAFYEIQIKDIDSARVIFDRAVQESFVKVDDLAHIYVQRAELELRTECFEEALTFLRDATQEPERSLALHMKQHPHTSVTVQQRLHTSHRVWTMYLDLEESLGTVESTCAAYDRAFSLTITTASMVVNYAHYLQENCHFDKSFQVYERGLAVFGFPHALKLWKGYLSEFVARYQNKKLERSRDLFETVLKTCPIPDVNYFILQYAELEETYGLSRRALEVYARGVDMVADDQKISLYKHYVKQSQKFLGVASTRPIYETAVEKLPDALVPVMCLPFSKMEAQLGEIDRARAIYTHASQFCDPRQWEESFWKVWLDFEVNHGNEQTFMEMCRVKRSVSAQYAHVNYMTVDTSREMVPEGSQDAMTVLENEAATEIETSETLKRKIEEDENTLPITKKQAVQESNPEEIDLDDDDEEAGEVPITAVKNPEELEETNVPLSIFGKRLELEAEQLRKKET